MAARLMAQSAQFVELEDRQDSSIGGGISRARMAERFREALRKQSSKMESQEVENCVDVCFRAILRRHNSRSTHNARMKGPLHEDVKRNVLKQLHGKRPRSSSHLGELIDLETFSVACSCNDPIEFEAFLDFFDRDRKLGFLERMFTPMHIRKIVDGNLDKMERLTLVNTTKALTVGSTTRTTSIG